MPPPPALPSTVAWHLLLCVASALSVVLYVRLLCSPLPTTARRQYAQRLRWLAFPMVLECAWRSAMPALYLQRFTYYDSPLNGVLLERTLACVGELSWNAMLALVIIHIDGETTAVLPKAASSTTWIRTSAVVLVATYAVAEGVSYYNTATTNEWWAAAEVVLDGLSQLLVVPSGLTLLQRVQHKPSSARAFLATFLVFAIVYPMYNFTVDAPMYMERYRRDQAAGKKYLPLWAGLRDAATRRHPTQDYADWSEDMAWMVVYFAGNPLAAISVAHAAPSALAPCDWCL